MDKMSDDSRCLSAVCTPPNHGLQKETTLKSYSRKVNGKKPEGKTDEESNRLFPFFSLHLCRASTEIALGRFLFLSLSLVHRCVSVALSTLRTQQSALCSRSFLFVLSFLLSSRSLSFVLRFKKRRKEGIVSFYRSTTSAPIAGVSVYFFVCLFIPRRFSQDPHAYQTWSETPQPSAVLKDVSFFLLSFFDLLRLKD